MASLAYYEILVALLCFVSLYVICTFDRRLLQEWPVVGMLPNLLFNVHRIHDFVTDQLERSRGTFLFKGPFFTNMEMLVTADPANVHYVTSTNFQNFPKGPQFRKIFDVLGDGIFNTDGDSWQTQRKLAQLHMGHRGFQQFLVKSTKDKVEKGLIPYLEQICQRGLVVDLQDLIQRFTFDTTCILVNGYDPICLSIELPEVPFAKAMHDLEETIVPRHALPECFWKLQRWLVIGQEKKYREAWATVDHILARYINEKREELRFGINSKEEGEGVDLLTSYLKNDGIMGVKCDDKFLRDTMLTLMAAGQDSVSSALTWFLWVVSTHPVVEARIREELEASMPKEGNNRRIFSMEQVSKLVYLHSAICESLRLYPPIPFEEKEPHQSDILPSGHHVHPKLRLLFSIYAMGRMKSIWGEDCLEFKPERWITKQGMIRHEPSFKFFAFNAGPRTCLGKDMAFTQIKMVAAAIIHNYQVRVVEGHPVFPSASMVLNMEHGLMANITKRWT
ncbi:hypothetical protein RHSIM_Rhsim10G0149300 [Rhododendron simsii]|uniref:Cytochrome P450 n=1 Tax=Rhododendron simsii TaxID=118357 RepID=A0A834GBJ6_RHOSS|nr:hypothetical protein RHSIM_Rhsim10G0149300 [Rhododendron simsii]